MSLTEREAVEQLRERGVLFRDEQMSAERLKRLRVGASMLLEPPIVMDTLPGVLGSCGRHTEIGPDCDFGLIRMIGSFCKIANDVIIGKAEHPTGFISVSNLFYANRAPTDFGRKDKAFLKSNQAMILAAGRKHGQRNYQLTAIGHDVFIGSRAIIRRGLKIGNGAIIAAGAVVVNDVEPYTIVAGVPARPVRKRFSDDLIKQLIELRWWRHDFSLVQDVDWTDAEKAVAAMRERLAARPKGYERVQNVHILRRQPDGTLVLFKRRKRKT